MKNIFCYLLISSLIFSCSKSDDDDSSSTETPTVAPLPPSDLSIKLTGFNTVVLHWKDNSSNETGFKIERKSGNGSFKQVGIVAADVTGYTNAGLITDSTYTYKVSAYNEIGTTTSGTISVTMYNEVTIGGVKWMKKNLEVEHYRNGDIIPQVTDPTEWATLKTGAWCYYQNKGVNGPVYSKLYNWYAVNDPRGLAPLGWHVATKAEWLTVTTVLGGKEVAGGPMKSLEHWTTPNTGATNMSGFSAVGAGARTDNGAFNFLGTLGLWWTADNDSADVSFYHVLYNNSTVSEGFHNLNSYGLSVRCVKD